MAPGVFLFSNCVVRESILECIKFILLKFVLENSTIVRTGCFGMIVLYS